MNVIVGCLMFNRSVVIALDSNHGVYFFGAYLLGVIILMLTIFFIRIENYIMMLITY